jgi:hypothetical protein
MPNIKISISTKIAYNIDWVQELKQGEKLDTDSSNTWTKTKSGRTGSIHRTAWNTRTPTTATMLTDTKTRSYSTRNIPTATADARINWSDKRGNWTSARVRHDDKRWEFEDNQEMEMDWSKRRTNRKEEYDLYLRDEDTGERGTVR